jgi:replicative DNA helicase
MNDTPIISGFSSFDAITTGLHKSDLITIAGGNDMGKTTFMLSLANNISKFDNL